MFFYVAIRKCRTANSKGDRRRESLCLSRKKRISWPKFKKDAAISTPSVNDKGIFTTFQGISMQKYAYLLTGARNGRDRLSARYKLYKCIEK